MSNESEEKESQTRLPVGEGANAICRAQVGHEITLRDILLYPIIVGIVGHVRMIIIQIHVCVVDEITLIRVRIRGGGL